ncbi:MAG TPA: hypothetical protein VIU46_09640 [Gallionellaceae bacterium]
MARFLAAVLIMLSVPQLADCHPLGGKDGKAPDRIEIRANHIGARQLLKLLADFSDQNLVIGGEFRNIRQDVNQPSASFDQLLAKLAADQGLAVETRNAITMVGSACRLATVPDIPGRESYQNKVSVNFAGITTHDAFWVLSDFLNTSFDLAQVNELDPLTLQVKDKPARDLMSAIVTVEGWSTQPYGKGGLKLVPNAQLKTCPAPAANPDPQAVDEVFVTGSYTLPFHECEVNTGHYCSDIEFYRLKDLTPVGFFRSLSSDAHVAVIRASSGRYYIVRAGERIGDSGKIRKIGASGLIVDVQVQKADGTFRNMTQTLKYQ